MTNHYLPNRCSLARQFGLNVFKCDDEQLPARNRSFNVSSVETSRNADHTSYPKWTWLIWPTILMAYHTATMIYSCKAFVTSWKSRKQLDEKMDELISKKSGSNEESCPLLSDRVLASAIFFKITDKIPYLTFCVAYYVWFHKHKYAASYETYLEITSVVFIFGWMVDLMLFSGITREFFIFYLVLKEILIKDILMSFSLVFTFTIIACSYAVHIICLAPLEVEDSFVRLYMTAYEVFITAMGGGALYDNTLNAGYLKLIYSVYISLTAIILVNVLIAVMNYRYDEAKLNAEHVWRHSSVALALRVQTTKRFGWVNRAYCFCLCCCCCCGDCQGIYHKAGRYYIKTGNSVAD